MVRNQGQHEQLFTDGTNARALGAEGLRPRTRRTNGHHEAVFLDNLGFKVLGGVSLRVRVGHHNRAVWV